MRRLLWKEKDDAKSDQTTDGIAIKKCNIHVKDGRWSLCDGKKCFTSCQCRFIQPL